MKTLGKLAQAKEMTIQQGAYWIIYFLKKTAN